MKNKNRKAAIKDRARRRSSMLVWAFSLIALALLAGYIIMVYSPKPAHIIGFHGPNEWIGKPWVQHITYKVGLHYPAIMANKSTKKVCAEYTAVHIVTYLNGELFWLGTGTLYTQKSDGKEYILTVGHLFDVDAVGTNVFIFVDINDPEGKFYGIDRIFTSNELNRSTNLPSASEGELDVAVCRKGPITLIPGYSHLFSGAHDEKDEFRESNKPGLVLTSLVSGVSYPMLGVGKQLDNPGKRGISFLLFDYESKPGESGSGFIGNDNAVYILMGSVYNFDYSLTHLKRKPKIGISRAMMLEFNQNK